MTGRAARWGVALALGGLWWWGLLRLVLAPEPGLLEGAVATGGGGSACCRCTVCRRPARRAGPMGGTLAVAEAGHRPCGGVTRGSRAAARPRGRQDPLRAPSDRTGSGGGRRARLAHGAPVRGPLAGAVALVGQPDAGAAAQTGPSRAAVHEQGLLAAAGGVADGALAVGLQDLPRERGQRGEVTGGQLAQREPGVARSRKHSSLLKTLPMPARLRWSSRASPRGRVGSRRRWARAVSGSQSGPSRSGPRWPTARDSSSVRRSSRTGRR